MSLSNRRKPKPKPKPKRVAHARGLPQRPNVQDLSDEPKFLYLAQQSFADTWVAGGSVPINPASAYLSEIRQGTQTPDEVMQKHIAGDVGMQVLIDAGVVVGGNVTGLEFTDSAFNGRRAGYVRVDQYSQNSLILCMCNVYDEGIMARLGHKIAVRIPSVAKLKERLDRQIGVTSQCGSVKYTPEPGNRGHFLKSVEDAWQEEYRLVWLGQDVGVDQRWVDLEPGLAETL